MAQCPSMKSRSGAASDSVRRAYLELAAGHEDACLRLLPEAETGAVAASMRAVALAAQACGEAQTDIARKHLAEASRLAIPLRALLRCRSALGRSVGMPHDEVYELHCLLAQFDPDAFAHAWTAFNPTERYRYACWAPSVDALRASVRGRAGPLGALLVESVLTRDSSLEVDPGLALAHQSLLASRPEECLGALDRIQTRECAVVDGLRLVASAQLASQAGDAATATVLFEKAFALGNPLPALLRPLGADAQLRQPAGPRAFECFSLLERIEPGSTLLYWRTLPAAQRLRFAPYLLSANRAAAKPHVYSLARHKRSMAQAWGASGLSILMAESFGMPLSEHPRMLPIASLQASAQAHALAFEELAGARDVRLRGPAGPDGSPGAEVRGRSRSLFVCAFADIAVWGKSNVLVAADRILMDHQAAELASLPVHHDFNLPVLGDTGSSALVLPVPPGAPRIAKALSLVGAQTSNFGHWLMEILLPLRTCLRHAALEGIPFLVDAQMPVQHRQALQFLAGGSHPLIELPLGACVFVGELWTFSRLVFWPGGERSPLPLDAWKVAEIADPDLIAGMVKEMQPLLDSIEPAQDAPRRLYLTRRPSQARPLGNRLQVEELMRSRGFAVVDLAAHDFLQQLQHLRAARTVVLEAGSSVFALLFCREGLEIGYFPVSQPTELECLHEVFMRLGHRMVTADPVTSDPTIADLDAIGRMLAQLERQARQNAVRQRMNMRDIEKYQQDYTLHFGFEEVLVAFRRRVLLETLARTAPRVVVEIGCGPERTYAHYMKQAEPVDQWLVVEPAAAWFEQARAAGLPGQSAIHGFFEERVEEVRRALVSAPDLVVCSGVMPEVESAPALLAAVRSIMGAHSVLFVNAPNWASFHRRLAVAMKIAARPEEPSERNALLQQRRIYDAASFRDELRASGFEPIREGGYFVKPFTNEQMAAVQGVLGDEVLEGLFELGRQHPEWAAEIFCEAQPAG
jgi:hypothetical protein